MEPDPPQLTGPDRLSPDWQTISSLATAGGTLVLAVATFSAVRSSNRSARVAEQSLLTNLRPLLLPSHYDDPAHKVVWQDQHVVRVQGGHAVVEEHDGVIYLALSLRNVGAGLALLHGWYPRPDLVFSDVAHPDPPEFRRLTIDLYVPAGGTGYWEGAIRDESDPVRAGIMRCLDERTSFTMELLYGDQEGGQRRISRYMLIPAGDGGWYFQGGRHWNVDRPDPR
ncbi:MAG TPA: hypothetical protein VFW24_12665 [Acidimicrobiales bacterium]|nr:hypothetical protein [Acidimicrobiales bacterium]